MKKKGTKAKARECKRNYEIFVQIVAAALTLQFIDWTVKNIALKKIVKTKGVKS